MNEIALAELLALEAQHCSHGDTVHYNSPIRFFEHCDGSYLYDNIGKRYLDFQMAYSAVNFGYRNGYFESANIEQFNSIPQIASEYVSKYKILLSQKLAESCNNAFGQQGRIHFNVGGAQSVDDSLKLVSVNKGNRSVFAFEGSYHGRTLGASSITSSYRYRRGFGSFSNRANFIPYPYCFRCPYGKERESCNLYCAQQFERLFENEYQTIIDTRDNETEYNAFYIEPIQGTGGYIIPPEGYFARIAKTLKQYDILLVADEIQMGFYRTGKMWACEHFDIQPDIVLFGKSLTNGLNPLSGLWAKESLINPQQFPPGSTHSSFASNPLGCRLGYASFTWMESKNYEETVPELGGYLLDSIKTLQKEFPVIGDTDGLGLAIRIEICHSDGITPNRDLAHKIKETALNDSFEVSTGQTGLVLDIGGYFKNVLTLAPSLETNKTEIDDFILIIQKILQKLTS